MKKFIGLLSLFTLSLPLQGKIALKQLADGFKRPVDLQAAPGNDKDLYVVEQHGVITAIDRETGKKGEVLLDISANVSRKMNEEGLLSLAFAPDFAKSGRFYVNFTDKRPKKALTHISRFILPKGKTSVDPSSEEILMSYTQDFRNHNGGWIAFGPDGFLYIGNGDGGAANDPKARAQDMTSLLGKLLRIDVSPTTGYDVPSDNPFIGKEGVKPEIYSYGLRNPWRCSFDGDKIWIADVGQNHYEEVNALSLSEASATPKKGVGGDKPSPVIDPIYQYGHGASKSEGLSVTGGFVYHGSNPELKGKYLFADYVTRRLWTLDESENYAFEDITDEVLAKGQKLGPIASFAQDNQKEQYIVDHTGIIWRVK